MTDLERRRRIEDLCDAALARDVPERAAFVAAACGPDEALRHEVEALLAHAQTAERFLESPIGELAAHVLADDHRASLAGLQIGSYRDSFSPRHRRDGRRVSGPRYEAGPRCRHQGRRQRLPVGPGAARAIRTRGAGAGHAEPSTYWRDLWVGGGRRRARSRARTRGRRDARRAFSVGSVAGPGGPRRSRARSPRRSRRHTRRASSTAI